MEGVEPTTPRLQITCSGQLSYIGERAANVRLFIKLPNIRAPKSDFSLIFLIFRYYVLQGTMIIIYLCNTILGQCAPLEISNIDPVWQTL